MTGILDERSRRVLEYVAAHEQVLVSQVGRLLSADRNETYRLLHRLVDAGLLHRGRRLRHQPQAVHVTAPGLGEIGSDLPVPVLDVRRYWQDLDAAWIWLAADTGHFGTLDRTFTRRQMLAADDADDAGGAAGSVPVALPEPIRAKADAAAFAVEVQTAGSTTEVQEHYPELMLVVPQGRIAVHLVRSLPGRKELEATITAYAAKPNVCVLLYLYGPKDVGDAVIAAAARVDQARFTHVQPFKISARIR
jgi:hypothetical protein